MLRGIERRRIFEDDADRQDFVDRLVRLIPEEGFSCFAWALIPNHVHLVLQTGPVPLSRLMARLGTGYARYFNLRHHRVGHLFQNRFRSILVEFDAHRQQLVSYVHLNPVRAGLVRSVEELGDYPWTGHAELMGRRRGRVVSVAEVLRWFDEDPSRARRALREQMSRDLDEDFRPQLSDTSAPDPSPLGAAETFQRREIARICQLPVHVSEARGDWSLDRLISWVCGQVGADESELRRGRRTCEASAARAIAAYLASAELGYRGVEIGSALSLGSGGTSRAISRGREHVRRTGLSLLQGPGALDRWGGETACSGSSTRRPGRLGS
jgi:putative transposase